MTTREQIVALRERLDTLNTCLDIPLKREQVALLQKKTESPDFWNDPKAAEAFMKNLNGIKSWVSAYDKAFSEAEDVDVLFEFAKESLESVADESQTTPETVELDQAFALIDEILGPPEDELTGEPVGTPMDPVARGARPSEIRLEDFLRNYKPGGKGKVS